MPVDLAGRATIGLPDDERAAAWILRHLAPFRDVPGAAGPGIRFEVAGRPDAPAIGIQGPAEDGITSGADANGAFVTWDGRRCWIPDVLAGETTFAFEPGFALWRILRSAIRPAIHYAPAVAGTAVAAHAASVTLDGGAIVVAGWAESGKTEVALALMERGASFLSDKWTVLGRADLEASAFPISIGVRRWVLPYLPTLAAATTTRSKVQFAGARVAGAVLGPIVRRPARSRSGALVPDLARKAVLLGDRAAYETDELRAAYGQADDPLRRSPIGTIVILRTIEEDTVRVSAIAPDVAAARLARTAAYERRAYLGLLDRFAYDDTTRPTGAMARGVAADEAVLRDICAGVRVLEVEAPFPADPGRIADAILDAAS
jgi:hypothetical protein